jgi:DNA-directed RNA polymerase subunit K/omega
MSDQEESTESYQEEEESGGSDGGGGSDGSDGSSKGSKIDIEDIELFDEQTYKNSDEFYKSYDVTKNNITRPQLNKYERTAIISLRAEQLSNGASTFIDSSELDDVKSVMDIAMMEFERKLIPFIIKRPISNNTFELWRLSDLI